MIAFWMLNQAFQNCFIAILFANIEILDYDNTKYSVQISH